MERPAVLNLGAGLDEALCVECETTSKPFNVGVCAGHHEHMPPIQSLSGQPLRRPETSLCVLVRGFPFLDLTVIHISASIEPCQ